MTEMVLIGVVIFLGGVAYWLFGDPDRSERLSFIIGPKTPLLWIVVCSVEGIKNLQERKFLWAGVSFLLIALLVRMYIKERAQRRFPAAST